MLEGYCTKHPYHNDEIEIKIYVYERSYCVELLFELEGDLLFRTLISIWVGSL